MSTFEYVMVLVSIVLGLALTHVLNALAAGIHRLRGHGRPLRLEAVYLLWVGFVVTWIVSFWWWEFRLQELGVTWSFGLYLFLLSYAALLFMLAAVLVPSRLEGVDDSYAYFMEGRRWFFWGVVALVAVDVVDTFIKGSDWGLRPIFLGQTAIFLLAAILGMLSERRGAQLVGAWAAFLMQLFYMFQEIGVLARFG